MDRYIEQVMDWFGCKESDITEIYSDEYGAKGFFVTFEDKYEYTNFHIVYLFNNVFTNDVSLSVDYSKSVPNKEVNKMFGEISKETTKWLKRRS